MIIGRFDSFIVNTGNNNCVCPKDSKYCRYTASTGGYQVTGYGLTCDEARKDWDKLASRKHYTLPAAQGGNGGLSPNSIKQAQATGSSNTPASIFAPIFGTGKSAGINASGSVGAGVTAGASITASVNDIKTKTNQVVSDIIPDSIEENIPAGIPLWILPVGLVGGLVLIMLLRR